MKNITVVELPATTLAQIYRVAVLSDELYRIGNSCWPRDYCEKPTAVAAYHDRVRKEYRLAEELSSYGTVWAMRHLLYAGTMGVLFTAE